MTNKNRTSSKVASLASQTLNDPNASAIAKRLAGSALSQKSSSNQTSGEMEDLASRVVKSNKYNNQTRSLAGSVLSQSNKAR